MVGVAAIVLGGMNRASLRAGVATVTMVVFLTFMVPQIYGSLTFLNDQRLMYRGLPAENAREKCLLDGGNAAQVDLLEFVRRVMPGKTR